MPLLEPRHVLNALQVSVYNVLCLYCITSLVPTEWHPISLSNCSADNSSLQARRRTQALLSAALLAIMPLLESRHVFNALQVSEFA